MKNSILILWCFFTSFVFSQQKDSIALQRAARENVRVGNKHYNQLNFTEAEIAYKKALSKNPNYTKAAYNLGNAIYQQNRDKEAVAQFELAEKTTTEKIRKSENFHNKGNAFMEQKQYEKAINAYKNALRNNAKDDETRYNLALAKSLLKKQQNKKNQKNKDKKGNKDKKNDKKDKDGGNKDKKNNKDKEKGKDKKDDKGNPKKDKNPEKKKDKKQPKPNQ